MIESSITGCPLQLDDPQIARRKSYVGLGPDDLRRIALIKDLVIQNADEFCKVFFEFLRPMEEAKFLFERPALLQDAMRQKRSHLVAMAGGDYDKQYVDERLALAKLYSKANLDPRVFMGAFHHLMQAIGMEIMQHAGAEPLEDFLNFMALKKIAFFDIGLIVDVLINEGERIITMQQAAIRELSTPVLQIRDRMLILPIIGLIDTQRAKQLTDSLLHAIRTSRAKVAVMDVTGVAAVDSKVANHLLQTVAAAKLMGTRVIITGLSSEVAQAMVSLGVDLGTLRTIGDLQGGLEEAERLLGYRLVQFPEPVARQ